LHREEARETQNVAQEPENPNGVEGRNPCKPKTTLMPKVILEDPQTQLYRDQMNTHALIYKFMGLWPRERTLCNWIKYHWKPSGEVELHLGLKGFFTTVFMNLEDRDKVFEGGGHTFMPQQDCTCGHGRKTSPQRNKPSRTYSFGYGFTLYH
jgi:hypothetical protein